MKTLTFTASQIHEVAQELWSYHNRCQVYTFVGPLGAGKTTLIRNILELAGVQGPITSPTFTTVNIYKNQNKQTFYHFDAYRVNSLEQFQIQGFDEYLYAPESWSFIEWPELLESIIKHKVCRVTLAYAQDDGRKLTYEIVD